MRKPVFAYAKTKAQITDSKISLLPKSENSVQFVSDLIGNPEDTFSHDVAEFTCSIFSQLKYILKS